MKACNIRKTEAGLISYMEKKGYTGLYCSAAPGDDGCGCEIQDLAPCGMPIAELECKLGYKIPSDNDDVAFYVTPLKPSANQ